MKVLGIVHEHTASVCLMEHGVVTFCQSEERLNRIKGSAGFPVETVRHLYQRGLRPESIDLAVVFEQTVEGYAAFKARNFKPVSGAAEPERGESKPTLRQRLARGALGRVVRRMRAARAEADPALRRECEAFFGDALKLGVEKIRFLEHHAAHAYSVLPEVGRWGDALIFTLDGFGDALCATVNLWRNGRLERLSSCGQQHSLGVLYWHATQLLGMRGLEDEFKVMGLAAYSHPARHATLARQLRHLLWVDEHGQWRCDASASELPARLAAICRGHRFDVIAGALQTLAEDLVCDWISFWIARTGCPNVAAAGGVFLNIKVSHRIAELDCVDRFFVMPSAGDESCAIGAAAWGTRTLAPTLPLRPLGSLYLGAEYSQGEIADALAEWDGHGLCEISRPGDLAGHIATLLAQGRIVARFAGRMEFGCRALGNRSILADPRDLRMVRRLNVAIKQRDFWMPFAPAILDGDLERYVKDHDRVSLRFMSVARESTVHAQREIPAALHPHDLTLRPQSVTREENPGLFEIVHGFRAITGVGAVINTSFNMHGEPIVCTPADALDCFARSDLDFLALGPYLVSRHRRAASETAGGEKQSVASAIRDDTVAGSRR